VRRIPAAVPFGIRGLLVACSALFASSFAAAQGNTSIASAADIAWGQKALTHLGAGATQFWYHVQTSQGRSYCAEVGNQEGIVGYTDNSIASTLSLYSANTTTLIATNSMAFNEPRNANFSRLCWIGTEGNGAVQYMKLQPNPASIPTTIPVEIRFVETTMFCPWFFIAGDYNAFTLVRNASSSFLSGVVVTWRGLDGTIAGTTTVDVPGNGGLVLSARNFVDPAQFSNGTIEIAHTGSPEQLHATTTTLSGTTGLGFDAQFTQRRPW